MYHKITAKELLKNSGKELVNFIKAFFTETPNSVLFWNSLLYIATIIGYIIAPLPTAFFTAFVGSIFFLVMIIDLGDKFHNHLWIGLTGLFWLILCVFGIILLGEYLYNHTIIPFNNWLNKPKISQKS